MFGNIGTVDRVLRGLIGLGLGIYGFMHENLIVAILSFLIIAMAGFKWCPLYHMFGINTDSEHCCETALNNKKSIFEGIIVSFMLYLIILVAYLIYRYSTIIEQPLHF